MILDEDYLSNTAQSQSRLKKILLHPNLYINYDPNSDMDEPAEVTVIGDGVDLLLTQGEDVFMEQFYFSTVERPTGQMGDFVWHLFANRNDTMAENIAYELAGFKRDTLPKVRERFEKEGKAYYDDLIAGEGKKVVSPIQYATIQNVANTLKMSPFTSKYVVGNSQFKVFTQQSLQFEYEGKDFELLVLDELGKLFVLFADETSALETYPTGRYLYVNPPDAKGMTVLDFNYAYNPPCAYTEFATCPIPPKSNRLPFAILAGEKMPAGHE